MRLDYTFLQVTQQYCVTSWKVMGLIPFEITGFFNWSILPAALWPSGWLSLSRKWVPGIFLRVKGSRHVRLTTLLPPANTMSRKCMRLNVLQAYGPSQPLMRMCLDPILGDITKYHSSINIVQFYFITHDVCMHLYTQWYDFAYVFCDLIFVFSLFAQNMLQIKQHKLCYNLSTETEVGEVYTRQLWW
jgi:hypothetical protein